MVLSSDRLYVRRYTLDDEEAFYLLNSNQEIMRYIRPAKSREDSRLFLQENLEFYEQHPGLGRWALVEKDSHAIAGMFSLLPLANTNDVHIGYILLKDHWGKGYAAEIVQAGVSYAFNTLKLPSLVAITDPANTPSQKVLYKNGFVEKGIYEVNGMPDVLFRVKGPAHRKS